ncbi:MAG: DUF2927 domain-containing protein [Pseudolabrys sp.]|nr:DUF2927 domain-containing protein [Pseudolabrys sp.]
MMKILTVALATILGLCATAAYAASDRRPAPPGAPEDAPPEYTRFTPAELEKGFLALAFGSDLRVGGKPKGIRKFTETAKIAVLDQGSVSRGDRYKAVVREFARVIPHLDAKLTDTEDDANVTVRLIDEKNFVGAMEQAFGKQVARDFVAKTDPQCMTSLKSRPDGTIVRADVFIIVDQGDDVFFDCAYHETLHAFGLSNHADSNPFTTLNQTRTVGYLSVYDRAMLTILYDPRMQPGFSAREASAVLPAILKDLGPAVR